MDSVDVYSSWPDGMSTDRSWSPPTPEKVLGKSRVSAGRGGITHYLYRDVVILDVGGAMHKTTVDTLKKYPGSYFDSMIRMAPEGGEMPEAFFIDRDGQRFPAILNFLRSGTVHIEGTQELRELLEEAEYFSLEPLQEIVKNKLRELELMQQTKVQYEAWKVEAMHRVGSTMNEVAYNTSASQYIAPGRQRNKRVASQAIQEERKFETDADF